MAHFGTRIRVDSYCNLPLAFLACIVKLTFAVLRKFYL